MPRPPRDIDAGYFHVTAHSVRDTALFRDDIDRTRFLVELARVTSETRWTCVAYCEMTTHYHLLLDVDGGALPTGMQALNFRYACNFNARHRTRGHVLERRYNAKRIVEPSHLVYAYRYVVRNPVAAKMCDRLQDWPWSSYASTVGLATPQSFVEASAVLEYFGGSYELAIARLREFVEEP